jgi:uncharacterized protein (TIGR03546 family)
MANQNGNGKIRNGVNKKHPFERFKRKARLTYLRILRIDDPPERIARGAAIGVAMGVLPTFGLGIILSIAFAFILRANKAASVLGSFIMNPVTSPFFWTASLLTGSLLTGNDYSTLYAKMKDNGFLTGAGEASLVFMAGNLVISAVTTLASYYIVRNAIVRHRFKKEEKRLRKRAGLH